MNVLKINLLEIINSLPQHKYAEYGYAVSFADIYDCLKIKGFNRDMLNDSLKELETNELLKLHILDGNIVAVSVI